MDFAFRCRFYFLKIRVQKSDGNFRQFFDHPSLLRGPDDFPKPCWTYAERRGNDPKLFLGNDRSPWLVMLHNAITK